MDLSLDDIIKMNRSKNNGQQKGTKKSGPNAAKPRLQRLRNLGDRSGITRKPAGITTSRNQSLAKETTMLHVSNLDYNVSTNDVRELFSDIGPLKKAEVHYDKSGRSLGTAEITFRTRDAAIKAINKYNKLPLDGRPMNITLVPSQTNIRSPAKNINKTKVGSGIQKRSPKKGVPRSTNRTQNTKSGGKFKKQPRKEVTAEELDAELEQYKSNKVTAMQH